MEGWDEVSAIHLIYCEISEFGLTVYSVSLAMFMRKTGAVVVDGANLVA